MWHGERHDPSRRHGSTRASQPPPRVDGDEFELGYGLIALTGLGVVGSRQGEAGATFHPRRRLPSSLGEGERAPQPTTLDRDAGWGVVTRPPALDHGAPRRSSFMSYPPCRAEPR